MPRHQQPFGALDQIEQHRPEQPQHHRDGDFRLDAGAEPDDDRLRQRHFRQAVERNEQRVDHPLLQSGIDDPNRQADTGQNRQQLCVKPRGEMTPRQIVNVDLLKAASAEFITMRGLAMRFFGLLRGGDIGKLDVWLHDARHCGLHATRSFVRKLRQDIDVVRNAILEPWSNGQVEGQINRLKTLKRAM
jgi:transposase